MNDAQYYDLWQNAVVTDAPFEQAVQAGRIAENPSLIFIAGYQSAIRATFPELRSTTLEASRPWYTFAVSEDRTVESTRAPVTMSNGAVSGFKTWIAAINQVDVLVLKVGSGEQACYGLVESCSPGVIHQAKDAPGFLREMSQGQTQFVDAEIELLAEVDQVGRFHQFEPYFIYVALLARLSVLGSDAIAAIAEAELSDQAAQQDLVRLDLKVAELLVMMADAGIELGENWSHDHRVFTMYSKRIQATADH